VHNCLEQADGGYKVIFWTRYFSIRMLDWGEVVCLYFQVFMPSSQWIRLYLLILCCSFGSLKSVVCFPKKVV
jgi:hypothetical protein